QQSARRPRRPGVEREKRKTRWSHMTDTDAPPPDGRITIERLDRVLAIGIDRPKKLNGFSPKMLAELAEAFTALEYDENAWVGVLFAEGPHFTAGLELDKVAPIMRE